MKKLSIIFFVLIAMAHTETASCQVDSSFVFYRQVSYPVSYFTTNISGELYTLSMDNLLKKYNINGDSVGVFNEVKKYGKLSYVEAQNPWKTILFYEGFQTIVLLDKYLKNIGSINLREKNIFNVRAVTASYDNNIWLFDGRDFKIRKLDDNGNTLMASTDFRQLFDDVPNPVWIGDQDGLLYLYDPEKGFYIFDYYGGFKSLLPFKNWKSVFVINKSLIGFDDRYLYKYIPPIPLPDQKILSHELQNADMITVSSQKVYVLKNRVLRIFKMN